MSGVQKLQNAPSDQGWSKMSKIKTIAQEYNPKCNTNIHDYRSYKWTNKENRQTFLSEKFQITFFSPKDRAQPTHLDHPGLADLQQAPLQIQSLCQGQTKVRKGHCTASGSEPHKLNGL